MDKVGTVSDSSRRRVVYARLTHASRSQERVMVEQLGKDGWDISIFNQRITAAFRAVGRNTLPRLWQYNRCHEFPSNADAPAAAQ
jgi:hypothetical protein